MRGAIAVLLVLVMGVIACDSTSEATVAGSKPGIAAAERAAGAFHQYLLDHFSVPGRETTGYLHLREVRVSGNTMVATTDYQSGDEGKRLASQVCSAISGFIDASENQHYGVNAVRVHGQGDALLSNRTSIDGRCQ